MRRCVDRKKKKKGERVRCPAMTLEEGPLSAFYRRGPQQEMGNYARVAAVCAHENTHPSKTISSKC